MVAVRYSIEGIFLMVELLAEELFWNHISSYKILFDDLAQGCQTQVHVGPKLSSEEKSRARLTMYGKINYN